LFSFIALMVVCAANAQTRIIAHRGFWQTAGSAQNSVASLLKADSIGCYGSEFDVWLTKDGKLVVNHDPEVGRLVVEQTEAKALSRRKLANGEPLPLLDDFLKVAKRKTTCKLILELKEHSTPAREDMAVRKIIRMVKKHGLQRRVSYISFSLNAVRRFIEQAPQGTEVYYLGGELSPRELKNIGCAGPDYHYDVFRKHPNWIDECHGLGQKVNVWTVRDVDVLREFLGRVDFITTDIPKRALGEE